MNIALEVLRGRCGPNMCSVPLDKRNDCHGAAARTLEALIPGHVQGEMFNLDWDQQLAKATFNAHEDKPAIVILIKTLMLSSCGIRTHNDNSHVPKPHPAMKPWTSSRNHEGNMLPALDSLSGI